MKIKLTDFAGKPFVGSTVVAIYDKSVEYISGGSNVPEIKEFFWKWRRQHYPQTESSLGRWFQNLVPPNTIGMGDLGVFGGDGGRGNGRGAAMATSEAGDRAMPARAAALWAADGRGGGRADDASACRAEWRTDGMAMPMARRCRWRRSSRWQRWRRAGKPGGDAAARWSSRPIRTKFADTALWVGALTTDNDGTAEVSLDMPENLTTWRIKVWGMGHGTHVGQGQTDVVTRKDLIIRLEAPRFFVQTDEVVLSAIVHNYLKTKKKVTVATRSGRLEPLQAAGRRQQCGAV